MKRLITFLLLLTSFVSVAQNGMPHVSFITKDSFTTDGDIEYKLAKNWRVYRGDDTIFASPGYNDSAWKFVTAGQRSDTSSQKRSGSNATVDWYRLHFIADSSIVGIPLAISMAFNGAAELFLDGSKVTHYGKINGKDSSIFDAPNRRPYAIIIPRAGEHLLAIRFMNYSPETLIRPDLSQLIGFSIWIGKANDLILNQFENIKNNLTIFVFLFSIFLALCVVHLLLFLYYRSIRSNLFFSIFCLSLSFVFFMIYLTFVSEDPHTRIIFSSWAWPVITGGACFSFSGINNEFFGGKRLRFRIIAIICLVSVVLDYFNNDAGSFAFLVLSFLVLIEAIILTVAAIIKKRKGARIVGIGIFFFAVFILGTVSYAVINKGLLFKAGSLSSVVFAITASCAILSIPLSMSVYLSWNFANMNKELTGNLEQLRLLSEKTLAQEQEKKQILENQKEKLEQEVELRTAEVVSQKEEIEKQHSELKIEKKKSDDLLLNILPGEVAEELKETGHSEARFFNDVTVLFTDFVDFTKAAERMTPQELVDELHTCFKAFDVIISAHRIEKIKTIGDAYLAVGGLPLPDQEHAVNVALAALEIRQFMDERKQRLKEKVFEIRIGIHSGSVVAGIVGVKKFAYDIWGDTVNTAARMEQTSEAGRINISQTTYNLIKSKFECTFRGEIEAKNKGALGMYFIEKKIG